MGADVIKVEPPEGDNTRYISVGPAPGMSGCSSTSTAASAASCWTCAPTPARMRARVLIAGADVFIHSMRAKAIAKLGFDYASVAELNPSIVYTNCYGYGHRGPERTVRPTTTPSRPNAASPRSRNN